MMICPKCGEQSEDQFDTCWKCGSDLEQLADTDMGIAPTPKMIVKHRTFRGDFSSWESLCVGKEACEFATRIGRDRVVSISHSNYGGEVLVVVWYWGDTLHED